MHLVILIIPHLTIDVMIFKEFVSMYLPSHVTAITFLLLLLTPPLISLFPEHLQLGY